MLFAEPLLDPAAEAQAIGRVHRIGQTRVTHIHRCEAGSSQAKPLKRKPMAWYYYDTGGVEATCSGNSV